MRWIYLAGVALAVLRLLRLSTLSTEVMSIATIDARDRETAPRQRFEPNLDWHKQAG